MTLVLGGISSGKSSFAESLASGEVLYVATALPGEAGIDARIAAHRVRRPAEWKVMTAVSGIAVGAHVENAAATTVLLDGFGLVVGAALESPDPARSVDDEVSAILDDAARRDWIIVSDETGLSPVALTPVGRAFQDILGRANQRLSAAANRAFLVVAGRAIELPPR